MAFSSDTDLTDLIPDILDLGISSFSGYHTDAQADIEREIRIKWWSATGYSGEMDATLLTSSQWAKASAYLVLWKYALPQLTNWIPDDRFQVMMAHYKAMYNDEMENVFADGVEYDYNEDSVISDSEKSHTIINRLVR
jgi:phage major head subunit gpT-like protein